MSDLLARARLLLAQSRPADAEREVMAALAAEPEDPAALALLALSRVDQKKGPAALEAVERAVGLAPDQAYLHYVHAHVLHRLDREREALEAVGHALRLDPSDADYHVLQASIHLARREWPQALEGAEAALALQAEHVGAANLRSMALIGLGRKVEAMATVDFALQRAPENAFSHANQGWNCLHRNDPKRAQVHFLEALRLEPDLEYARNGMLEALKAGNPVYRLMLAYFLWMGRLAGRYQWGLIVVIWFGGRSLVNLAGSQPRFAWFWWSLVVLLYLFVYLSWTAQPMFNLLLRFHRFGRHVLSRDQRVASNWFGAALGAALVGLALWRGRDEAAALFGAIYGAVLSMCLAATFHQVGRTRKILGYATLGLAVVALASLGCLIAGREFGLTLAELFIPGFIAFQILANVLAVRRSR